MVGFGELRKLALKWQTDIAVVERVYALDWLLSGIFGREGLWRAFALRGATALGKAYFPDYPPIEDADFVHETGIEISWIESELSKAAANAAGRSGLRFELFSVRESDARVEFTGPLGRRSAAQPRLPLRFSQTHLHSDTILTQMLHPFSERCEATVRAVSLEEIAAGIAAGISAKPRARDVFDLWFIIRHGVDRANRQVMLALSHEFARERGLELKAEFDPGHRLLLERAWDGALKHVRDKPAFAEAEAEITGNLKEALG